jgi:hypothetical protein
LNHFTVARIVPSPEGISIVLSVASSGVDRHDVFVSLSARHDAVPVRPSQSRARLRRISVFLFEDDPVPPSLNLAAPGKTAKRGKTALACTEAKLDMVAGAARDSQGAVGISYIAVSSDRTNTRECVGAGRAVAARTAMPHD